MDNVFIEKNVLMSRISEIVLNLFENNNLYNDKLDKDEIIQHLINLFGKFNIEDFQAINDEDLVSRIDSILVLEATAGILNDLTPEQMEIFDAAVAGR